MAGENVQLVLGMVTVVLEAFVTVASTATCSKLGVPHTTSRVAVVLMPCAAVVSVVVVAPTDDAVMASTLVASVVSVRRPGRTKARTRSVPVWLALGVG